MKLPRIAFQSKEYVSILLHDHGLSTKKQTYLQFGKRIPHKNTAVNFTTKLIALF